MSLFPTRSQILGYIFSFSSSKHIGTYWVLDTYLGIEKMKNTLKSVIARVISFSLFTDRFRNILQNKKVINTTWQINGLVKSQEQKTPGTHPKIA